MATIHLSTCHSLIACWKKIHSNSHYPTHLIDPSEGHAIKLKNIWEAIAAITCEEQGIFKELHRSRHVGCDFIDQGGIEWDVKTARTHSLEGKATYNQEEFCNGIEKKLQQRSYNLIIDITDLNNEQLGNIMPKIKSAAIANNKKVILIDRHNSPRSGYLT